MHMDFINIGMGNSWGFGPATFLVIIWSIFWKGLALWHSAKRNQGWWFLILLVVNTVGILEIVYLFAVLKLKVDELIPKPHHTHPDHSK